MSEKDNNDVFKALSSETRRKILAVLSSGDCHVAGLARRLKISVPVASKHVKLLEECGLVKRRKYGRTHIISLDKDPSEKMGEAFLDTHSVTVKTGSTVLEVLRKVSAVEIKHVGDHELVASIGGKEGFYIYEIDSVMPDKSISEMHVESDVVIRWKRLVPVTEKEIRVEVTE
ncbi:MAG: metalloregulator ArsR/SmtB family transcription factor [Methanosarcinales archaeon]